MFGFRTLFFTTSLACSLAVTAASANVLLNPDFEDLTPSVPNNGNNIGYAVPNWMSTGSSMNLVQVDGVTPANELGPPPPAYSDYVYGGFWLARSNPIWHFLGPESDADAPGPGIAQHYVDIVGGTATLFQSFTLPLCPDGNTTTLADVEFGAHFTNRQNRGATVNISIHPGTGLSTALSGSFASFALVAAPTFNYPWTQVANTVSLTRGQTYTFATEVTDFANIDNAFATIQPASACSRSAGSEAGVAEYLQARNSLILAHEPDRHRRLDKINRSRSLSGASDGSEALPFDLFFDGNTARFAGSSNRLDAENALGAWDFWVEGYLAGFGDDAGSEGLFGVGYAGVDYQFNERAIVGVLLQVDRFDMDFDIPGDEINGTGWMVGPYATIKLHEKLFFDIRGAWGQSDNDVKSAAGTTGSFDTNRWLVSGALVGEVQHGNWEIRPELQGKYISERQAAFDNDGTTTQAQTISQGEVRFGPRVAYHHVTDDDVMITPYVRADGIYNFADNGNAALTEGSLASAVEDSLHARVEAGVDIYSLDGVKLTLSGNYNGIGQSNFETYGGMLRVGFQLD